MILGPDYGYAQGPYRSPLGPRFKTDVEQYDVVITLIDGSRLATFQITGSVRKSTCVPDVMLARYATQELVEWQRLPSSGPKIFHVTYGNDEKVFIPLTSVLKIVSIKKEFIVQHDLKVVTSDEECKMHNVIQSYNRP